MLSLTIGSRGSQIKTASPRRVARYPWRNIRSGPRAVGYRPEGRAILRTIHPQLGLHKHSIRMSRAKAASHSPARMSLFAFAVYLMEVFMFPSRQMADSIGASHSYRVRLPCKARSAIPCCRGSVIAGSLPASATRFTPRRMVVQDIMLAAYYLLDACLPAAGLAQHTSLHGSHELVMLPRARRVWGACCRHLVSRMIVSNSILFLRPSMRAFRWDLRLLVM